jgi:hypothetical protein
LDETEKWETIKTIAEALKPWLNYDLWTAVEDQAKNTKTSTTFIEELKAKGLKPDEIQDLIEQQEGQAEQTTKIEETKPKAEIKSADGKVKRIRVRK